MFKIAVNETGISMLSQDSNGNWIDETPVTKITKEWMSIQSNIECNNKELKEHANKLINQC